MAHTYGRNNMSLEKAAELAEQYDQLDAAIEEKKEHFFKSIGQEQSHLSKIKESIYDSLGEHFGTESWEISIGGHECKDSPVGHCIYNSQDDPCHDDCLICHQPAERK